MLDARERLIVALDLPSVEEAERMVSRLGDTVCFYKIGYQLAFAGGLPFAAGLIAAPKARRPLNPSSRRNAARHRPILRIRCG